jgi:hypothetical protein
MYKLRIGTIADLVSGKEGVASEPRLRTAACVWPKELWRLSPF